jgi:hypothetical protein
VSEKLEEAAWLMEDAAAQLERAAAHCRVAAGHFRDREVPRAGAHAWAAVGHLANARDALSRQARDHAARSFVPEDEPLP